MPTLNWIGKEAVIKHHQDVPFRLLEPAPELSLPSPASGRGAGSEGDCGDNLHALKALLPRYAGQVKCIYIDPPYNTGNEGLINWGKDGKGKVPAYKRYKHLLRNADGIVPQPYGHTSSPGTPTARVRTCGKSCMTSHRFRILQHPNLRSSFSASCKSPPIRIR